MKSAFLFIITITAFISTNLDDLFILMAFFTRKDFNKRDVILGQYIGMISLILISSTAYFFQLIIPKYLIGLLGFIPIIIGVRNLYSLTKNSKSTNNYIKSSKSRTKLKYLAVAIVTFANGGDNIGIYAPLFAGMDYLEIIQVIFMFMIMTGLWSLLSFILVDNKIIGRKIKKYGNYLFPFFLIIIGILIIIRGLL